jgi:hypothetical protein
MKRVFLFLLIPPILIVHDWTMLVYMAADDGLGSFKEIGKIARQR